MTTSEAADAGRTGDALFALPTDAESWRRAVENYSDADDAARGERQHVRVTAAQMEQVVEGAPLTAGDRVRLRELLVSKRLARVDLELSARKHGLTAKGSKFDALVKAEEDRLDQQIKTLVGESYFGEIKKPWGVRGGLRIYTVEFVGEVSRRGMRLSDGQAEALTGLVDELKEDESRLPVDPSTGLTVFDEQMLGGAKQMLSPAQLDIFRRVRIDTNLSRVAMELKKQRRLKEKAQQEAGAN